MTAATERPRPDRAEVLITCTACGRSRLHAARGLCGACYNRARGYHAPRGTCATCGRRQPILAHGQCSTCYNRDWRDRRRAAAPP